MHAHTYIIKLEKFINGEVVKLWYLSSGSIINSSNLKCKKKNHFTKALSAEHTLLDQEQSPAGTTSEATS